MSDVDTVALVLRIAVGGIMIAHGVNHWVGGGKAAGTGRWFESLGLRPGILHAYLSIVTEIGAGLLLILGFLTPLAGAGVAATLFVAFFTVHIKNGFFIIKEGWEYVGLIILVSTCISALGAGRVSIDHAIGWDWTGWWPALITLVGGLIGALGLLVTFWRPNKTKTA